MTSNVEKLNAQHARDLLEAQQQDTAAAFLDSIGAPQPKLIHIRNLYGVRYSWDYGGFRDSLDAEQCAAIVDKLPPAATAYARGDYRYFVPAATEQQFIEAREGGKRAEEITEFFEIVPFWLKLDHFGSTIKYHAAIGDEFALVSLKVSESHRFGATYLDGHVKRYTPHGPVSSIDDRRVVVPRVDIYSEDEKWLAQFADPILYASGSRDHWGHGIVYAYGANWGPVSVSDFRRALEARPE